jgi:uncharacterized membrane protein
MLGTSKSGVLKQPSTSSFMKGPISPLMLAASLTFVSVGLLGTRLFIGRELVFIFLVWNLFLAWIPFLLSNWLIQKPERKLGLVLAVLGLWLLFLPNAPYILTDLFHLRTRKGAPKWMDLVILVSFAWTGLILGLSSIRQIQTWLFDRWGSLRSWLAVVGVLALSSFGVYLGRFLRWNSWDVIHQPGDLFQDILKLVSDPINGATGFTIVFTLFLLMAYGTMVSREGH